MTTNASIIKAYTDQYARDSATPQGADGDAIIQALAVQSDRDYDEVDALITDHLFPGAC